MYIKNKASSRSKESSFHESQLKEALLQKRLQELKALLPKNPKRRRAQFFQLMGWEGQGAKRVLIHFLPSSCRGIWISRQWRLYAPRLWQMTKLKNISLVGLEQSDRHKDRQLWEELYESRGFDFWVLDSLPLREADGAFLKQLVSQLSLQVFIIQQKALSFCDIRARVQLSHENYRVDWQRGNSPHSLFFPADDLKEMKEDLCLL